MTDKQKRFADEYLIDCNAEQSAIRAGYSENYARGNAHKLVANSCIKTYIDNKLKELENEKIATADEVMKYLTSVMRGDEIDEKVIESEFFKVRVQTKDRLKAAELLSKRFGLDKTQEDNNGLRKLDEVLEKIKGVI